MLHFLYNEDSIEILMNYKMWFLLDFFVNSHLLNIYILILYFSCWSFMVTNNVNFV